MEISFYQSFDLFLKQASTRWSSPGFADMTNTNFSPLFSTGLIVQIGFIDVQRLLPKSRDGIAEIWNYYN